MMWFGFVPLLLFLDQRRHRPGRQFLYLLLFFGWLFLAIFWMPQSLVGGRLENIWEAAPMLGLYSQGVFGYSVVFWLALRISNDLPHWLECLVLPLGLVSYEYLMTIIPGAFPFYSGIFEAKNIYMIQSVSILGPWIITFLIYWSNFIWFKAWSLGRAGEAKTIFKFVVILLLVLLLNFAYGWTRVEKGRGKGEGSGGYLIGMAKSEVGEKPTYAKICLVQPNLDFMDSVLSGRMDYFYNRGLRRLVYLTQPEKDYDLIVWPELAILKSIVQSPNAIFDGFSKTLTAPIAFGSAYYNYQKGGMENSIVVFSELGLVRDRYRKVILFPKFEGKNYLAGEEVRPLLVSAKLPAVGGMLCFESLLPQVSRELRQKGAQFLMVLANDVWFGNSAWPRLHLNCMVFRAIENGCVGIHLGNLGPSAVFSPYGEMLSNIPFGKMACANVEIDILPIETLYYKFGDWFACLCVFGVVIICLVRPVNLLLHQSGRCAKSETGG